MNTKDFFTSNRSTSESQGQAALSSISLVAPPTIQPLPHFDTRSVSSTSYVTAASGYNQQSSSAPTTEYTNSSRGSTSESTTSSSGRISPLTTTVTGSWSMQRLQTKPPTLEDQAASAAQRLLEELQKNRGSAAAAAAAAAAATPTSTSTSTPTTILPAAATSVEEDTCFSTTTTAIVANISPPAPHPPSHLRPPANQQRPSGPDYAPKQSSFSEFLSRAETERASSPSSRVSIVQHGLTQALQQRRLDITTQQDVNTNDFGSEERRDHASDNEYRTTCDQNYSSRRVHRSGVGTIGRQRTALDLSGRHRTTSSSSRSSNHLKCAAMKELNNNNNDNNATTDADETVSSPYPKLDQITSSIYDDVHPKGRFKNRKLRMNLSQASDNYPVLPRVCKLMGWRKCKVSEEDEEPIGDWSIAWRDTGAVSVTTVRELIAGTTYRKINHFPGMGEICLKHCLGHHMNRMRKNFKSLYKHVPRTWVLPVDIASLKEFMSSRKNKNITLICKPTHMCQGRGIYLTKKIPDFNPNMHDNDDDGNQKNSAASKMLVVQQYISKPLLINQFKFDLRIYVAITSCLPHMRAFIHREGLTRFCTEPYQAPTNKNIDCSYMHLTNYAVNKKNTGAFVQPSMNNNNNNEEEEDDDAEDAEDDDREEENVDADEDGCSSATSSPRNSEEDDVLNATKQQKKKKDHHHGPYYDFSDLPPMADISPEEAKELLHAQRGSKWSVTAMFAWLAERGHDTHKIWMKMQEVIALTLLPIMNILQHRYRASFSSKDDGFGCFELLGFDIMLDHKCVPILIEVNHSPSFETASPLDNVIKTTVIRDTLRLAGIDSDTLLKTAKSSELKKFGTWAKKKKNIDEEIETKGNENVTTASSSGVPLPFSSGGNKRNSFGSGRTAMNGLHGDTSRGPTMPMRSKNGREKTKFKKRNDDEIEFLERLRTSYEKAHLGGFERIIPLSPNIDIDTANDETLMKRYELYQQVSAVAYFYYCSLFFVLCYLFSCSDQIFFIKLNKYLPLSY